MLFELSVKAHLNSKCFSTPVGKTLHANIVGIVTNMTWLNINLCEIIIIPWDTSEDLWRGCVTQLSMLNVFHRLVFGLKTQSLGNCFCFRKFIIWLVALHGREIWPVSLRKHRLRAFKIRALRRRFGPKIEVTVGRGNTYNAELHNYYSSQNIIRLIRSVTAGLTEHVTRMREMRVYRRFWLESRKGRTICKF